MNVGDSLTSKERENWGLTLFAPRQPNSKVLDWTEAKTKLMQVGFELPPFCEDLELPSLCEGDYSKNTQIVFIVLLHRKIGECVCFWCLFFSVFFNLRKKLWKVPSKAPVWERLPFPERISGFTWNCREAFSVGSFLYLHCESLIAPVTDYVDALLSSFPVKIFHCYIFCHIAHSIAFVTDILRWFSRRRTSCY